MGIFLYFYIMKHKKMSLLPILEVLAYVGIATYTAIRLKRRIKETFTMYDGVSPTMVSSECSAVSAEKYSVISNIMQKLHKISTVSVSLNNGTPKKSLNNGAPKDPQVEFMPSGDMIWR